MVLAKLGGRISRTVQSMNKATTIDETVLNGCLNEIARALLHADVQFELVREMQSNIKKIVNFQELAAGQNKRKIIQQAIFNELCRMLDPGKPAYSPDKKKTSIVMFVGLQGSGKTTACTKYAQYYLNKGWKPALVCADTFRAGAFDQLKDKASKAKIPFFGSYTERDPVKIAEKGIERFKKEKRDLIIVDTSGKHKQEATLFEEMRQVSHATNPDLVIFVMDSNIGQAAYNQAHAFKNIVSVGAVIVTKMDGHAKGGGALSAVAATKSPIIFLGTGENIGDFEAFNVKPFVKRILGTGCWFGSRVKIQESIRVDWQSDLLQKLSQGKFTLRFMYELFQTCLSHGKFTTGEEKESQVRMKMFMTIMDSMTNEELDSLDPKLIMTKSRIRRVVRGSGRPVSEAMELLDESKRLAKLWSNPQSLNILNFLLKFGSGSRR